MSDRRPIGITILAVLDYSSAAWCAVLGIVSLIGERALTYVFSVLNYFPSEFSRGGMPGKLPVFGVVAFLFAGLFILFAHGLWKLRNWARVLVIVFAVSDLISGGLPSTAGPVATFTPDN